MNEKIFLGFTKNGRPVRHKPPHKAPHVNTECYNFQKMDVVQKNETVKNEDKSQPLKKNRHKNGMQKLHELQQKKSHELQQQQQQQKNTPRRHVLHAKKSTNSNTNSTDVSNLAKKQKTNPKKWSGSNSVSLPKFRHGNHRRNKKGGKVSVTYQE